jgi:hypothetical protein
LQMLQNFLMSSIKSFGELQSVENGI